MSVAVIILGILSIVAVGYAAIVFQPAVWEVAIANPFFCSNYDENSHRCITTAADVDPNLLLMRNSLYNISIALPIAAGIGVIMLWGYLSISRRAD